jgi:fatty-acyl-CoA synthase
VRDDQLQGVDLSAVRVMGCGAEPINAAILRAFARRFAHVGFAADAFYPSYGMAESTLAISFSRGLRVDRVSKAGLATGAEARPVAADDGDGVEMVSCGGPFEGHELRVFQPGTDAPLADRRVGEIRVRGPSVMRGYFMNADATRAALPDDGWLRTGDLGYVADGEVFVCGRLKDLIIVRGRNIAPQDVEWTVTGVEGVRPGGAVAFGVARDDGEGVVVVAEAKDPSTPSLENAIKRRILEVIGVAAADVVVVPPRTIPKTSSGKVKRQETRARYLAGTLVAPRAEGVSKTVGRIVASQLAHLRVSLTRGEGRELR